MQAEECSMLLKRRYYQSFLQGFDGLVKRYNFWKGWEKFGESRWMCSSIDVRLINNKYKQQNEMRFVPDSINITTCKLPVCSTVHVLTLLMNVTVIGPSNRVSKNQEENQRKKSRNNRLRQKTHQRQTRRARQTVSAGSSKKQKDEPERLR